MIKTSIVRTFLKKVEMNMNILFMRIYKRIEFGINLIHDAQGSMNMLGEIIN